LAEYYVPLRQIPDNDVDKDIIPSNPQTFVIPLIKKNQGRVIASVGSVVDVTPFDMFGHRTISLMSQKGRLEIVQAVSRIEPDHVVLDAVNYNWQVGASLSAVPRETLDKLLRQKVKEDDVAARLVLCASTLRRSSTRKRLRNSTRLSPSSRSASQSRYHSVGVDGLFRSPGVAGT